MNIQNKVDICYEVEGKANEDCVISILLEDFSSAIDHNEVAYRAAINRYLLTDGKAREKALIDLGRISEEYRLFKSKLKSQGGN
jgi:hypothetical protein